MEQIVIAIIIGIGFILFKNRLENEKNNRKRLAGTYSERFITFLQEFPYEPSDAHFLGKPIDYIVFDGLSEKNQIRNIVFVEVKTNSSRLSKREREVKKAIKHGRVKYKEFRV